ncbi:NAD-dependent deacylase [Dechloromonas sp. ZS-1]|uniref:SIR2 family NAD-dependent protein deacylase n=1 Tax=Dechloromonas sp. ZS-1 TaxID=3138067 RepID=UPI0031FDBCAE
MGNIEPNILERLRTAKRVVVLSGAGLSAESGIPTFRDATSSLWSNVDPMVVASLDGFERDPERVWAWHEEVRKTFAGARPNAGHEGIALLEMLLQPATVQVITQNVDGFHQEAGSGKVLEIHGTTRRVRCHRRCGYVANWVGDVPRKCPICAAQVRPDVVWFGESLDGMLFEVAEEAAEAADVFFVVGTSGVVQPAAGLATLAKNSGALVVVVNPFETPHSVIADHAVRESASDFFPSLCKAVRSMRLRQVR